MASSNTNRVTDFAGRGFVFGNFTLSGVTTGAFSVPFNTIYHAQFCSNISATPVTYLAGVKNISYTGASGDSGTYQIYGE